MKDNYLRSQPSFVSFDNSLDAWYPEIWAQETLALVEENMVVGNLVYRDFSPAIANFGDTVNTRLPGTFVAKRKGVNDDVTVQDASATNVPVVLNQHAHTSFMIRDGEESMSMKSLINEYLRPAALSLAQFADKVLLGQVYQYLDYSFGGVGSIASTNILGRMLGVRERMNVNNVQMDGRVLILSPKSETAALTLDTFHEADKVGDQGTALREASLGRKLGFNIYMCQNTPSVTAAAYTTVASEVDAAKAVGDTTLAVDSGHGSTYSLGQYITVEGDAAPTRVTNISTDTLTISRGIKTATAANAGVTRFTTGTVDLAGHTGVTTYPAGYTKEIKVDGAGIPHQGQLVAFATGSSAAVVTGEYSIVHVRVDSGAYYITLDRPLDYALGDNYVVDYGPNGEYNFAFVRDALALVTRPLALPRPGTGALAGVASFNNLSLRTVITYDGDKQGHLVTLDMLLGVKVLQTILGAVMLG